MSEIKNDTYSCDECLFLVKSPDSWRRAKRCLMDISDDVRSKYRTVKRHWSVDLPRGGYEDCSDTITVYDYYRDGNCSIETVREKFEEIILNRKETIFKNEFDEELRFKKLTNQSENYECFYGVKSEAEADILLKQCTDERLEYAEVLKNLGMKKEKNRKYRKVYIDKFKVWVVGYPASAKDLEWMNKHGQ